MSLSQSVGRWFVCLSVCLKPEVWWRYPVPVLSKVILTNKYIFATISLTLSLIKNRYRYNLTNTAYLALFQYFANIKRFYFMGNYRGTKGVMPPSLPKMLCLPQCISYWILIWFPDNFGLAPSSEICPQLWRRPTSAVASWLLIRPSNSVTANPVSGMSLSGPSGDVSTPSSADNDLETLQSFQLNSRINQTRKGSD